MGIWLFHNSRNESAPMSQFSGKCRSRTMPSTWALKLGLAQLIKDGPKRGTKLSVCARVSAPPHRALSRDSSLSRYMLCLSSPSSDLSQNLTLQPLRPKLGRFKGFRQDLFLHFRPHCSGEEVRAASKLMLTAFSSRARLLDSVLPLNLHVCPQAWIASVLQKPLWQNPRFCHQELG